MHFTSRESNRVGFLTFWSGSHAVLIQWPYCSCLFVLGQLTLTHSTSTASGKHFLDLNYTRDVRRTISLFLEPLDFNFLSTLIPLDESARNLASSCGFTKPILLRSFQIYTLTSLKRVVTYLATVTDAAAIFVPPGQFTKYKRAPCGPQGLIYIPIRFQKLLSQHIRFGGPYSRPNVTMTVRFPLTLLRAIRGITVHGLVSVQI